MAKTETTPAEIYDQLSDHETEALLAYQALYQLIDAHPFLSGLMTREHHRYLEILRKVAHHLDEVDPDILDKARKQQPDPDLMDRYLG